MDDLPKVGDIWVGEDDDGSPIFQKVTHVMAPDKPWNDWLVSLDDSPLIHRGWWYGQGWSELEEEDRSMTGIEEIDAVASEGLPFLTFG